MDEGGDGSSSGDSGYSRQEYITMRIAMRRPPAPRDEPEEAMNRRLVQSLPNLNEEGSNDERENVKYSRSCSDNNLDSRNMSERVRQCYRNRRRAWSPDFQRMNILNILDVSPIGEPQEFRSYSSSRASSVVNVAVNDGESELEDVFPADPDPHPILNQRLTISNVLLYFQMVHLLAVFFTYGDPSLHFDDLSTLFNMTDEDIRRLGITRQADKTKLTKVMPPYFRDPDSS
ncbi:hypothetical protein DMENIID0001_064220 [Sergentomyia squamirostris]